MPSTEMRKHNTDVISLGSSGGRTAISWVGVGFVIITWTVVSLDGLVSPLILPSPLRVITAAGDVGLDLVRHILATLARILVGFAAGAILGLVLGTIMQFSRHAFLLLDGIVETMRPVPAAALVPFFILLFGFSETGKLVLVALGAGLIITVATVEAIERVPAPVLRWGMVAGLSRVRLFRRVIIPAALPELRSGFRIALAVSVTLVVVAEFMGATYGLGYLINVSRVTLTTSTIFLAAIILGWLSWGLDKLIRIAFDWTCAWDIRAKGAVR